MNLKLESKADFIEAFKHLEDRIIALENSPVRGGFLKPDIITKMTKPLADAIVKARTEFLPLQKSITSKKDGKTFASLDDYIEASSNAFSKNGISVSFEENVDPSPNLVATISLKGTVEKHVLPVEVKPANMTDPKMAMKYGFQNAKVGVYKTITQLK